MVLEPLSTVEPYNINCSPSTEQEIGDTINRLKNGKSPGIDGIPAEIYKVCKSVHLKPLHQLFTVIWVTELFPYDWGTSILLIIAKKGDKSICDNY